MCGRFIQHQQIGLSDQQTGQSQPTFLTTTACSNCPEHVFASEQEPRQIRAGILERHVFNLQKRFQDSLFGIKLIQTLSVVTDFHTLP